MKNKYLTRLTVLVAFTSLVLQGFAYAGNDSGNGGGGVNQDGRYMTFYSAGLLVDKQELTLEQVPQLRYVTDVFMTTASIPAKVQSEFYEILAPSSARKYYNVQATHFTPEVRARLIAEYSRITGLDASKLALFAITETNSKTTYLLPEFYHLRPTEQAAVLFHEAYWIKSPESSYQTVVNAEITFQRYLENMQSKESQIKFLDLLVENAYVLPAALILDVQDGSLDGFLKQVKIKVDRKKVSKNVIMLTDLLSQDFLKCYKGYSQGVFQTQSCTMFTQRHIYSLIKKWPRSIFLKYFLESLQTLDLYVYSPNVRHDRAVPSYNSNYLEAYTLEESYISIPSNSDNLLNANYAFTFKPGKSVVLGTLNINLVKKDN